MKELAKAILTHVKSNSDLYESVGSDVYLDVAPDETSMPFMTYSIISGRKDRVFGTGNDMTDSSVQFTIWDNSSSVETILNIYEYLNTAFDRQALTYDTKSNVWCAEETFLGPIWEEDVWMIATDYRIICQGG